MMDKKTDPLKERGDRFTDSTPDNTFKLNKGQSSPEIKQIMKKVKN